MLGLTSLSRKRERGWSPNQKKKKKQPPLSPKKGEVQLFLIQIVGELKAVTSRPEIPAVSVRSEVCPCKAAGQNTDTHTRHGTHTLLSARRGKRAIYFKLLLPAITDVAEKQRSIKWNISTFIVQSEACSGFSGSLGLRQFYGGSSPVCACFDNWMFRSSVVGLRKPEVFHFQSKKY